MSTHVRFAPSPTGLLHVGNARAALVNWLFARKTGGVFTLRLDDTDTDRGAAEFATAIEADLRWLGLDWDKFFRQSDRMAAYDAAIARLKAEGWLYPCFETPEELELKRKLQLAQRKPPVYDRAALKPGARDKAEAEGRSPHWRFRLTGEKVTWQDAIKGEITYDSASISDPVLIRADGRLLYTLCSCVDDAETGVTHIIRGEDHVTNTAAQILIFRALGAAAPEFAHFSLFTGAEGEGLSKRTGSLSLRELRADGLEPMAVNSLVAALGTSDAVEIHADLAELVARFDLSHFGKSAARFDPAELWALNAKLLHNLPFDAIRTKRPDVTAAEWDALHHNIEKLSDLDNWLKIVRDPIDPVIEDAAFTARAAGLLPARIDGDTWSAWTNAVKAETGAKGKALFHPLRLALTGLDHGPEMRHLLPLIGYERAVHRLRGERA